VGQQRRPHHPGGGTRSAVGDARRRDTEPPPDTAHRIPSRVFTHNSASAHHPPQPAVCPSPTVHAPDTLPPVDLSASTAIIRRQAGVITRGQALATGITRRRIDGLLSTQRWTPLFQGVYLSADAELTWSAMAHAATLAAGLGATLVGDSAAALRHLVPTSFPVTVAIPAGRRSTVRHP